jgi:Yip1 domain
MLESFYSTIFRPDRARIDSRVALLIGLLVILILALNASGTLGLEAGGAIAIAFLFLLAGLAGWYWLSASANFLAQLMGGQGTARLTAIAIAQGFWPLIFAAPAIATSKWSQELSSLLSLTIILGVCVTFVGEIRHAHQFSWGAAILCFIGSIALAGLAIVVPLVLPLMVILGT